METGYVDADSAWGEDRLWVELDCSAGWDALALPEAQLAQLRAIAAHLHKRDQVVRWGGVATGLSLLFAGEPGTGKVMAARVLGADLDRPVIWADVRDPRLHERADIEQMIAGVHAAAEQRHAIVVFDGLGPGASGARSRGPLGIAIDIGLLLRRDDPRRGVVALAWNTAAGVDAPPPAVVDYTVDFPMPSLSARGQIWRQELPADAGLRDADIKRLAKSYPMTGEAIRRTALAANAVAEREGVRLGPDLVLAVLKSADAPSAPAADARPAVRREAPEPEPPSPVAQPEPVDAPEPPATLHAVVPDPGPAPQAETGQRPLLRRVVLEPEVEAPRRERPAKPRRERPPKARRERPATVPRERPAKVPRERPAKVPRERSRGERHWGRWALGLVGCVAVGAAGYGVERATTNGSSTPPARPAAASRQASSGAVRISYPNGWRLASAASPIDGLTSTVSVAPDRPGELLVIGKSSTQNASLLPSALLTALPKVPSAQVVTLGGVKFYRYSDLSPRGASSPESVYALPTTAGTIIGICAGAGASPAFVANCESILSTLRLASGSALAPGPSPAYASALDRVITTLSAARTAEGAKLRAARTPAAVAAAASGLAASHTRAAASLLALKAGQAASANSALAAAFRTTAGAYTALAKAAARKDQKAYRAASADVSRGSAAISTALSALGKLGYTESSG